MSKPGLEELKNQIIDFEELKKTSDEITANLINKQHNLENIEMDRIDNTHLKASPKNVKTNTINNDVQLPQNKKKVGFQKAIITHEIIPEETKNISIIESDIITIANYNISKQTLYLLIALIVIGCVIWYMTGTDTETKTKEKDKKRNNRLN